MKKIFLILVLLLALAVRFYRINQLPSGFNADEAAIGYNAYSLLETGKDEHGNRWPLHFQSFNDFKPGGYIYLILPLVKFFGLNEFVVRLPSILAGVLSVYLIYLLVSELFPKPKLFGFLTIGGIAAFFLALSPWHIHFSRGAWETSVATFFQLLGIWLFLKGTKKPIFFIPSIITFIFSTYVYHSTRLTTPLLLLFLVVVYRRKIWENKKILTGILLVGLVLGVPLLVSFAKSGTVRFSGVGLVADVGPLWDVNRLRGEHGGNTNAFWLRIIHNWPLSYFFRLAKNWASHFEAEFLFVTGDKIKRSNCPDMGQFYWLDLFFLLTGFYFWFRKKEKKFILPFYWLLIAPIPAAITFQAPHALRAQTMVYPWLIISAFGAYHLLLFLKKKKALFLKLFLGIVLFFYLSNFAYFLNQYFVIYPQKYPEAWEYGFKELVAYLGPIKNDYSKIYVTEVYDQPYILFLFYLKYPPEKFQTEAKLTPRGKFFFSTVRDFDRFHFERIDLENLKGEENILIVGTDEEIPEGENIIKTIYFPNGAPAFEIVSR